MAKIDDGGPAFPQLGRRDRYNDDLGEWETEIVAAGSGMSLRDYFAGQALAGIFASRHLAVDATDSSIATEAYEIADAMLRARTAQSPADVQAQHLGEFGK